MLIGCGFVYQNVHPFYQSRPGTIFEQWRQYCCIRAPCSFKVFHAVWRTDFKDLITFAQGFTHTVCPTCIKHKLLIRHLNHDSNARLRQRLLYDRHLASQFQDRQWYWKVRAESRLLIKTITIIIDGIDQAKFMWPRSSWFNNNKDFDKFTRPRLHIWGILVHGWLSALTISHGDVFKGGATTCEVIAWVLTELNKQGVDLSQYHIHLQLDNTSSSNKNNIVFSFMAALVLAGLIAGSTIAFLRVGHTHEAKQTLSRSSFSLPHLAPWLLPFFAFSPFSCPRPRALNFRAVSAEIDLRLIWLLKD